MNESCCPFVPFLKIFPAAKNRGSAQERGGWDLLECLVKRAAQYHLQLTFCEDWLVGLVGGGKWHDEGKLGSIKPQILVVSSPEAFFSKGSMDETYQK